MAEIAQVRTPLKLELRQFDGFLERKMALTAEVLRSLIKHHGLGQSIQRTAKAIGLSA